MGNGLWERIREILHHIYQELMSRPKGGKELPTQYYNVQPHLILNDNHTFLLWNYSQAESFTL